MALSLLVSEGRQAKVDGSAVAGPAVDLGELVLGAGETDAESFDLAEPAFALGLRDAGGEVVADFLQPAALGRVWPEERATNTSVFMDTRT
ncbi:hypothetical protein OOK13_01250 [Streptomyces sp. NBC_00378]|uniref:hypothetical protein n=1 Tax=unclassified Streptomyces TaxID=2593676 RepID=UPI00224F2C14|nr:MULTISPECIES: hypothetical protein [unclassified Streptomyces]MCX5107189.1 hypothetical protein [Streptomyces sp. NBC_00378]